MEFQEKYQFSRQNNQSRKIVTFSNLIYECKILLKLQRIMQKKNPRNNAKPSWNSRIFHPKSPPTLTAQMSDTSLCTLCSSSSKKKLLIAFGIKVELLRFSWQMSWVSSVTLWITFWRWLMDAQNPQRMRQAEERSERSRQRAEKRVSHVKYGSYFFFIQMRSSLHVRHICGTHNSTFFYWALLLWLFQTSPIIAEQQLSLPLR